MNAKQPEKAKFTVIANDIKRLHPRIVTIILAHHIPYEKYKTAEVNLPIESNVYVTLLKNMGKWKFRDHLPLIFLVNSKGVAFKVMPLTMYNKQQENSEKEP
jgi:hypothetical protein